MEDWQKLYQTVLPIRNITVTLQFIDESKPRFFHQLEINSLLRYWLESNQYFERYFRVDCPESGQSNYSQGDYYRFTLYSLGSPDELLQKLLKKLKALPGSAPVSDIKAPFRNNLKLHNLQDGFTENSIQHAHELTLYNENTLQQEIKIWQQYQRLRFRWTSPARLLKDKQKRKNLKGEARFCRDTHDTDIHLLLSRLHDRYAEFNRNNKDTQTIIRRSPPPRTQTLYSHLFWLDNHYTDKKGKKNVIGGLCGLMEFSIEPNQNLNSIWPLLILGQFSGIGQRTSFGYGRYLLETPDEGVTHRRCLPAQSLLMRAMDNKNLQQAWEHILKNSHKQVPDQYIEDPEEDVDNDNIQQLANTLLKIQHQQYKAPELTGIIIEKPNGGVRSLAVPPFRDRVLQRALSQILTPALEQLFYNRSYGYRPGRSRITAKETIQAAWRAGYRWVYESDIEDFFNSVTMQRLRERLIALYDNDPSINAIINWMSAPVRFEQVLIERKNGLPQGSPLSPLLANLMLDDFDNDMRDAGFMLIRYADDFIVLCKDQEQAHHAADLATKSLQEHGFKLNESKTHVKTMEQGFKYLGYLFVNDMALDVGKNEKGDSPQTKHIQPWLANIGSNTAHKLKQKEANQLADQWLYRKSQYQIGERDGERTLLCITGVNAILSTSMRQLRVHRDDKLLYNLPWSSIQAVLLFGNHHITTPAMHAAMQAEVPIHFSTGSGKYHGTVWNAQPAIHSYELWVQQIKTFKNKDNALYAARQIVNARLIHQKETLRQRKITFGLNNIDSAIRKLHLTRNLSSLNGKEGSASQEYFKLLQTIIPQEYGFEGRQRRPPKDPFNALLSLGYTMLYGYTESIIRASGLLPWAGFYHQSRGRHAALASDLMEPFRHLIERTALTMLIQKKLKPENFTYTQAGACHLTDDARRKYMAAITQRLEIHVKARGQTEPQKILTHIHKQCLSLIDWIIKGEPFHAWRTR